MPNKGIVYDCNDDNQHMMVVVPKDLSICGNCYSVSGMITINLKDFPLFDVYESFGDFMADVINEVERSENEVED